MEVTESSIAQAETAVKSKTYNSFWQYVRAVCIIAVVLIHAPSGTSYGSGSYEYITTVFLRQFINFPVAIFIFLSGYFTNIEKVKNNVKNYIFRRGGVDY